jgi:N-acetyl-anhydromuramoyl-L-alanine amidase
LKIDQRGMLHPACYIPSPNCDERPPGCSVDLLVIHNISLPPSEYGGNGVIELFTNCLDPDAHPYYKTIKDARVSCHFFIRRNGEVIQFVPCGQRAWHAGVSNWEGRERCNDFSIGIELEGSDFEPFSDAQYSALIELTHALQQAYPIQSITGHSDIAPGRKTDPGPYFDWDSYRRALEEN